MKSQSKFLLCSTLLIFTQTIVQADPIYKKVECIVKFDKTSESRNTNEEIYRKVSYYKLSDDQRKPLTDEVPLLQRYNESDEAPTYHLTLTEDFEFPLTRKFKLSGINADIKSEKIKIDQSKAIVPINKLVNGNISQTSFAMAIDSGFNNPKLICLMDKDKQIEFRNFLYHYVATKTPQPENRHNALQPLEFRPTSDSLIRVLKPTSVLNPYYYVLIIGSSNSLNPSGDQKLIVLQFNEDFLDLTLKQQENQ
jgi:hypothetical protein